MITKLSLRYSTKKKICILLYIWRRLVKQPVDPVAMRRNLATRRNLNDNEKASDSGAKNPRVGGRRILKRIQLLFVAADIAAYILCISLFVSILLCIYWEFANEVRSKIKSHAKRSSKVPKKLEWGKWGKWGMGHGGCSRWGSWESVCRFDIFFRRKIEMGFITLRALGFEIRPFIAPRVESDKQTKKKKNAAHLSRRCGIQMPVRYMEL